MIKKIMCLLLAVVSCFVLSVSAFAAVPTDEALSSTGNEFLDSYFADWEEAGEQAVALRDAYSTFLNTCFSPFSLTKLLGDALQVPVSWLRVTKAGLYAINPLDNVYYWLVNNNLVFDDRTSGESIKKTVDQTVNDPTIYVPTPWIGVVEPIGGGGGGNNTGNLSLSGVIGDVSAAGSGFFKIGTKAFDFMLSMPLCFLALGCGFCFTALGLARRTLRASKRS